MTTGSLLSRSFSVFFADFLPHTLLTAVCFLPILAYALLGEISETLGYVVAFGPLLVTPIATAAITFGVVEKLRGRAPGLGRAMSVGLARMLPVLGVSLLAVFAILGGTLLLVIPGIIASCMLYVAVPVAVIEQPGLMESLKRSAKLTEGSRWMLFGVLFVIGLINSGVGKVLELGVLGDDLSNARLYFVLTVLLSIFICALSAVSAAVAYSDLRRDKEGVEIEGLASVFD